MRTGLAWTNTGMHRTAVGGTMLARVIDGGDTMSDRMDEIRSTRAPRLRTDQIEILKRYGEIRKTKVGEVLFRAGDTHNDFVVVLEGEVKVGDNFPGEARTIGV